MTATLTACDAQLAHLDPTTIDTTEGFNPRTSMDDQKLAEITASVAKVGVIQPVIVTRHDERYLLVVGHRRLTAAQTAKTRSIPALVYDTIDEAVRLQLAIVENLQREDINPIDEAAAFQRAISQHGLTQKRLADVVGKSRSHVSDRLRLLKLPPEAQRHIANGKLPLSTVKVLTQVAKVSAPIADGCARLVASGEAAVDELLAEPQHVVGMLADVDRDDAPFLQSVRRYGAGGPIRFAHHIDEAQVAALNERAEALQVTRFVFDNQDIDAARSYGCLLELGEGHGVHQFITDAKFTFDRVNLALDRTQHERATELATQDPEQTVDTETGADHETSVVGARRLQERRRATEQAARRKKRDRAEQARLDAITANRQLGLNLVTKLGAKKVDRDTAELLARIVLAQNQQLAGRGIRYTHDDYHTLERLRQKNGKIRTKFTPAESTQAHDKLVDWVMRPKQPEEIIGRLLQALIAGTFADHTAVAQSQRTHWHMPARGCERCDQIIAKLAAKLLPEHFQHAAQALLPKPKRAANKDTRTNAAAPRKPKSVSEASSNAG